MSGEVSLCGKVDQDCYEKFVCVFAPDFKIPPPIFFLPRCTFPPGIVSEHNGSTCLHCEVDIVTESTLEAFSLLSK